MFFFFGGGTRKTWRFKPLSTCFFLNYQQLCGTKSFGRPDHCETPRGRGAGKEKEEVPGSNLQPWCGPVMGDQLNQQSVPDFSEGTPQGQQ